MVFCQNLAFYLFSGLFVVCLFSGKRESTYLKWFNTCCGRPTDCMMYMDCDMRNVFGYEDVSLPAEVSSSS